MDDFLSFLRVTLPHCSAWPGSDTWLTTRLRKDDKETYPRESAKKRPEHLRLLRLAAIQGLEGAHEGGVDVSRTGSVTYPGLTMLGTLL